MIKSFDPSLLSPSTPLLLPEQTFSYGNLTVQLIQEEYTRTLIVTGDEKMHDDAIEAMAVYLGFDPDREIRFLKMISNRFYRCLSQRK